MRDLRFFAVCLCLLTTAATGSAASYTFQDTIDLWGPMNLDARPIVEDQPFSYQHDVSSTLGPWDVVTAAELELDFTNDAFDWVFFGYDTREFVSVGFENGAWVPLGEVDPGVYDMVLNVSWLNDGILDVTIEVDNLGWNPATAWLDHSRLTVTAEAGGGAPPLVPEPVTVLALGSGLAMAGAYLRRRRVA